MYRRFFAILLSSLILAAACGSTTGSLVVGVTSQLPDLDTLDVVLQVDGEVLSEQQLVVGPGGTTSFPAELAFDDVDDGSTVAVTLRGFDDAGTLRVERQLETTVVGGEKRLVRVVLEAACRLEAPGGPPSAPICDNPTSTCIAGACDNPYVPPASQEPYTDDWAGTGGGDPNDVCMDGGTPSVQVGVGQSDFFAVDDYAVAQVEAGPQGGHHVWVAARLKNLTQSGSITEVGAELPSLGLSITPLKIIFTFDQDEGGYCKIFGLRLQLDIDGDDIQTMLGQEAKVLMTITDANGTVGTGEKWITLSQDIL